MIFPNHEFLMLVHVLHGKCYLWKVCWYLLQNRLSVLKRALPGGPGDFGYTDCGSLCYRVQYTIYFFQRNVKYRYQINLSKLDFWYTVSNVNADFWHIYVFQHCRYRILKTL